MTTYQRTLSSERMSGTIYFIPFNISEENYTEWYEFLVCLSIGRKWAVCNSFRLFLHSIPIFELDVSELSTLTPAMKQLTKLQTCNSFLSEIDYKLLGTCVLYDWYSADIWHILCISACCVWLERGFHGSHRYHIACAFFCLQSLRY